MEQENVELRKKVASILTYDGTQLWVCCNKCCGVSMVLNENTIIRFPVKHNHAEIEETPEVRKLIQKVCQETKIDLLKPVTHICQQYLKVCKM
jgi:hypothetical protein